MENDQSEKSESNAERQSETKTDETLDIMRVNENRRNYLGTCKAEVVCSKATVSAFLFLHPAYLRPTSPLRSPSPSAKMSATKLLVYSASVLSGTVISDNTIELFECIQFVGATILACIVACGILLQDINNLYTNVLEEMDGFRVNLTSVFTRKSLNFACNNVINPVLRITLKHLIDT